MARPTIKELRRQAKLGPPYPSEFLALLEGDERITARELLVRCKQRIAEAEASGPLVLEKWVFEQQCHDQGFARVAGVDEAGRGPLAGPLVAAAVVLASKVPGLNDSKQLTVSERERFHGLLQSGGHAIGIAVVEPGEIDRMGIQGANYHAMAKAVERLDPPPDFVLVDGFEVRGMPFRQQRIVKGDSRSLSIAAASIIAKVTRDRIMDQWAREYPQYDFGKHKGYGTREHLEALVQHGPCPIHRMSFSPLSRPTETETLC